MKNQDRSGFDAFLNEQSRRERSLQFVTYIKEQMRHEYGFDLDELAEKSKSALKKPDG